MDLKPLSPINHNKGILGVEWATFAYILFTTILIFVYGNKLSAPYEMLHHRTYIILGVALCIALYRWRPCWLTLQKSNSSEHCPTCLVKSLPQAIPQFYILHFRFYIYHSRALYTLPEK